MPVHTIYEAPRSSNQMARYRYLAFGLASVLTGFMLELAMNLDQTGCQRHEPHD